jgi:hypothetical protein
VPSPLSAYDDPEDTADAVLLKRAVAEIGSAMFPDAPAPSDEVRRAVALAIETGRLDILARHSEEERNICGVVPRSMRTPEGWLEAVRTSQLEFLDQRPGISVRQRRRIPVPHWLFVTRASLNRFLKQFDRATADHEARGKRELAELLRQNPDLSKNIAKQKLSHLRISEEGFDKRVWPKAREAAGLPGKARAGRKPKPRAS